MRTNKHINTKIDPHTNTTSKNKMHHTVLPQNNLTIHDPHPASPRLSALTPPQINALIPLGVRTRNASFNLQIPYQRRPENHVAANDSREISTEVGAS